VKMGAGRLTRRIVDGDPPLPADFTALRHAADEAFDWLPSRRPSDVVFVGGTATNLLKLLRRLAGNGRPDALDRVDLQIVRETISSSPAETVAAAYGLREQRVRLLAAGAAIIETVLDRVGAERGRVVDTGIREGAIIAAERAGDGWRDRLDELAHGWIA